MSHTPGPWEIRRNLKNHPYQISAPNGSKGPGGITDITRWAAIGLPSSVEGESNARLIAAAPDMLEALQILIGEKGLGLAFSDRIMIARKAISKAEGVSK